MDILIASNNAHKLEEIKNITNLKNNNIISLKDVNFNDEIIENGDTYYDNAKIKALAIKNKIKDTIILSDDSGLEINYFNGEPGLNSARFLNHLSQKEKNNEILERMKNVSIEERSAQFVSVVCCILPDGETHFFNGICSGHISTKIQGEEGFGYDPIFIPSGFLKSFGLLSSDIKNTISHRAKSFRKTLNFLVYSGLLN